MKPTPAQIVREFNRWRRQFHNGDCNDDVGLALDALIADSERLDSGCIRLSCDGEVVEWSGADLRAAIDAARK